MRAGGSLRDSRCRWRCGTWLAGVLLMFSFAAPARAAIILRIVDVGYPAFGYQNVVRTGNWAPVVVDVELENENAFDGTLRVGQIDGDGDLCVDEVPVNVRIESGGVARRYLYVPANPARANSDFAVELLDQSGGVVEVIHDGVPTTAAALYPAPVKLPDDTFFILDITLGTVTKVREMGTPEMQEVSYDRDVVVGHIAPLNLPEHWIGLEMIDAIVWDEAAPNQLNAKQTEALIEWVHRGGVLLVAASRTAPELASLDAWKAVLPAEIGEVAATTELGVLRDRWLELRLTDRIRTGIQTGGASQYAFAQPKLLAQATCAPGARVLHHEEAVQSDIITERRLGRGRLLFSGITMRELFSEPGSERAFFERLFLLRQLPEFDYAPELQSLFPTVAAGIGFSTNVGLYLLIAFVFSIAYVSLATLGLWGFLSTRGWRHQNWPLFTVVVALASFLSLLAVSVVQGVGQTVHQISVVDLAAGDMNAQATAYIGLKSSSDTRLDVWLPSNHLEESEPGPSRASLRPLGDITQMADMGTSFTDPVEYQLAPGSAAVEGVRLRATLKRFEGFWDGLLPGTVRSAVWPRGLRLSANSVVINDLGTDLEDCYLIQSTDDLLNPTTGNLRQTRTILVHPIGELPNSDTPVNLYQRCFLDDNGSEIENRVLLQERSLDAVHKTWSNRLRDSIQTLRQSRSSGALARSGSAKERTAFLMASTLGEWDFNQNRRALQGLAGGTWGWSRHRLRHLDMRTVLGKDTMVLVGFAREPGPVRIATRKAGSNRDYRVRTPSEDHSWTMYRIRIPVGASGVQGVSAPKPDEGDASDAAEDEGQRDQADPADGDGAGLSDGAPATSADSTTNNDNEDGQP
jgi:hypothetical protein